MNLRKPYLVFLGDATGDSYAKTGFGLRDWCRDDVVGEYALPESRVTLGLPFLTPAEAAARGAKSFVIGVAPIGGGLPAAWIPAILEAVEAGLDIVSGMHDRLESLERIAKASARTGVRLHNVRHSDRTFSVGSGKKRSGKRLLTVGTDCALGKKYTALVVARELTKRGIASTFRASGQTGIMIAGEGIAIDRVVVDFIAGAAEALSPPGDPDHWDVIEGQGSLFHPAYAAVSLGLLHGSQPDAMILCHDPTRTHVEGYPHAPLPSLAEAVRRNEEAAWLTNPAARCVVVSLNTSKLDDAARSASLAAAEAETGLPAFDPMRDPLDRVFASLLTAELA